MSSRIAAELCVFFVACGGPAPALTASLHFTLDPATCPAEESGARVPESLPLSCGGELSLAVIDAGGREERCVSFGPKVGGTLRDLPRVLADLAPLATRTSTESIAIEVAIRSPAPLVGECAARDASPAYRGASRPSLLASDAATIEVPLSCVGWGARCDIMAAPVGVSEVKIERLDPAGPAIARPLDVRLGYRAVRNGRARFVALGLLDPLGDQRFAIGAPRSMFPGCPLVSIVDPERPERPMGGCLESAVAFEDGAVIDRIVAGEDLSRGVIVGRVSDALDRPLAGITVVPAANGGLVAIDVTYPRGLSATSTTGLFLVRSLEMFGNDGLPSESCCVTLNAMQGEEIIATSPPVGMVEDLIVTAKVRAF